METIVLASLALAAIALLAAILITLRKIKPSSVDLKPIIEAIKNIPKPEIPPVKEIIIPPAKEVVLDLNPVIEAIQNIPKPEIPIAKEVVLDLNPVIEAIDKSALELKKSLETELTKIDSKAVVESATLMRVNQAEFQSGLEAFHKAIEKLLSQIPTGDKEMDAQKELMQKFEEAFVKVQEKAAEAVNENSLRLQEILAEILNKEAK